MVWGAMSSARAGSDAEDRPTSHRRRRGDAALRTGRRVVALLAAPPLIVWLLCGLTFSLSAASAIAFPPYAGFDEPQHVDMVVSLLEGDGWPAPGHRYVAQGVAIPSTYFYNHLNVRPFSKLPIPPRGKRPSFDQEGGDKSSGGLPNQIVQHPPLYYATAALLVRAWPGAWDQMPFTHFLFALRLVSAFIIAWLPLLAWGLARALRAPPPVPVAAAALTLAVPGVIRVGGMVNNDGLLAVLTAAVLIGAVRIGRGDLSWRTAAWSGVLLGLALLTKGFALTLVVAMLLAYAVAWWRHRAFAWRPLLVCWGVGFVVGGWWWLRNLVLYGRIQPQGYGVDAVQQIRGPRLAHRPPVGHFLSTIEDLVPRSFFEPTGAAGFATLSRATALLLAFTTVALIAVSLIAGVRRHGSRLLLLLILLPLGFYLVLITAGSASVYFHYGTTPGLQGRYLYGLVPSLAVLAAVAVDALLTAGGRGPRDVVRWTTLLVVPGCLAAAAAIEVHAFASLVNSFWAAGPHTPITDDMSNMLVVAPWSRWYSLSPFIAVGAVTIAIAAAVVVRLRRRAAAADDDDDADLDPALAPEGAQA
jgi:hypothetical protein